MKKLLALILAAMMVLSMAAVASAEEQITLKIAHIGPTTGAAAQYGLATLHGAEIAVEEINAAGGKYRIELINEDDEHNVEKVINAYNAAMDAGAQMILGTTTSKPCEATAAVAYDERTFMLTPSASAVAVIGLSDDGSDNNDNVFQICFTDPNQGLASAQYISEHKVADAQNNGAEVVFLPMYYGPASMILQTAAAKDYKPVFFGVDGMDGILGIEGFDTSLAEGVMLLTPFVATATDEKTVNFVTKYQAAYGETPIQFAADAYDGIYILAAAAEAAGITEGMDPADVCEAMIAVMPTITVEGLTGTMQWDASGAVTKTPMAAVIENGVYVVFEN